MKTTIHNLIILDESGSMCGIRYQTITGCNETINTIKAAQIEHFETQKHSISIYAFQESATNPSHYIIKDISTSLVEDISGKDYNPEGCTPLFDAIGDTLTELKEFVSNEENGIGVVTIITDGMENASQRFHYDAIVKLIAELKELGWTFNFIGANIDAASTSKSYGIDNYLQFQQTEEGTEQMWGTERRSRNRIYSRYDAVDNLMKDSSIDEKKAMYVKMSKDSFWEEKRITPDRITDLPDNGVLVFGSDIFGSHNGGMAAYAVKHFGAIVGRAEGPQGKAYAIPTTGLTFNQMKEAVDRFIRYAMCNDGQNFYVPLIGCGHAGYLPEQIAPLFVKAASLRNVWLPSEFRINFPLGNI